MVRDRPDAARVQAVVEHLRAQGLDAVWVDRAPVFDKTSLLHAIYQAIPLEGGFGFNWDALADALYGPEDPGAWPRVLVFRDLELLEERDPAAARTFLDIAHTVASDPRSTLAGVLRAADAIDEATGS